ncbi:ketopantoate reductase family protein [Aureispira anguillae]|uniref:2-dehydropantoate 2-reductase n=1 Tax=Aureispira anguillae TaxID=2864201 RepID=A0A915YF56_9BACT|nr:ketopantoate reductase C-terminal domain-containing protein [Aureispira anguillae]BDS11868.1 hypothetical protein AsAng_0025820 [Aureispira anguillae]
MKLKKIGILGLGAIGSVIATALKKNETTRIFYYNRSPKDQLRLKYQDTLFQTSIDCSIDLRNNTTLDWLIICLKEHQYSSAHIGLKNLIGTGTKVVVIRNGLRHKESVEKYCTRNNPILEVIIDCPTQPCVEGGYEQLKKAKLLLKKGMWLDDFTALFSKQTIHVLGIDDFKTASWKKVAESAALGAVLCLSGATCWIFEDEQIQNLYSLLLREAIEVALADGAKIEASFEQEMLIKVKKYPPNKGSSMLTDRLNGKTIELGAKNGIIVNLGNYYNVPTPMNHWVCTLLNYTNKTFSVPK